MEALCLFKDWKRYQLRDCNYRNCRIFTLKCISKEWVPVSIRLKTTIKTEKARKIIRMAEKDLQARVKSINSILGDNAKQSELSRSQLASTISTSTMDKCQWFIHKVSEFRFFKIKERQINKFNRLLLKKEGNITWFTNWANPPQAGSSWAESTGSQAANTSPPKEAVPRQRTLMPRQPVPLCRQSALSLKEIVLSPHKQVVLRQPVPLLRQSALTPRER